MEKEKEKPKQTACPCTAFGEALRAFFIEKIGDEFFLASREGGGGSFHSLIYGPKIKNCPFCGMPLETPAHRGVL